MDGNRPEDVNTALNLLIDYDMISWYQKEFSIIVEYIKELEEYKNNNERLMQDDGK